jgi:Replication initiation and membrane attachment protein (DnaB).
MAKRFADSDKYKKQFIRNLPVAYKVFWEYICLDCNHAGIWQVDLDVAQLRIGEDAPISLDEALKLFNKGERRIQVVNGGSKWFIAPFIDFQYGELNPSNRVHLSVMNELHKNGIKHLASPLLRAKDKDKDMDENEDISLIRIEEKKMKIDLEQHLLHCWGRDGRISQLIMTKLIDLMKIHGRDNVLLAIEEAAKHNAKNLAYVTGILEKHGTKKVDTKTPMERAFATQKALKEQEEAKKHD